jgi:hypothetical protein
VAILPTGNINSLGLPAAIGGSGCSALKGCGSNQDSKRTDASNARSLDDDHDYQTSFEQSLHSEIKEQENATTGHAGAPLSAKGSQRDNTKLRVLTLKQPQAAGTGANSTRSSNGAPSGKNQDAAGKPEEAANTASVIQPLVSAILVAAAPPTAPLLNTNETGQAQKDTPDAAITPNTTTPEPATVNGPGAAQAIDSLQNAMAGGGHDTLAFNGTLQQAPKPATAEATSIPVIAVDSKSAGLGVSSDPNTFDPKANADKPISAPHAPGTNDSKPTTGEVKLIPQNPAVQAQISRVIDGNSSKSNIQLTRQNEPVNPSQASRVTSNKPPEESPEGSFNESAGNSSQFQQDSKHGFRAVDPPRLHQTEVATPAFPGSDANPGLSNGSPINNSANVLSKSTTLPIDQQADASQPSMKTDLNVRIQGQSGENINVRISERAGDIQISVRSSDQTTASTLRHELPSIQAGLERAGWHLENGGMGQSGQDSREPPRDSQDPDRNRDQNQQTGDWQDRNQRRKDSSAGAWFELDQ